MLKKLQTFDEIYSEVESLSQNNFDRAIPLGKLEVMSPKRLRHVNNKKIINLTDYSQNQLLQKLNFSVTDYFRDTEQLQMDRLSYRLEQANKREYVFRMTKNGSYSLRGVVTTQKYQKFDALDILDSLHEELGKSALNRLRFDSNIYDDDCPDDFRLSMMLNEAQSVMKELGRKFAFSCGLSLFTSEIGRLSLYLNQIFMRMACTNGIVVPDSSGVEKHRHVGGIIDWFKKKLHKVLNSSKENFSEILSIYSNMENILIESLDDMKKTIIASLCSFELPYTAHYQNVYKIIEKSYPSFSLQSLVNGLTDYTQRMPLSQRFKVERGVGEWLINPNQYEKVLVEAKSTELSEVKELEDKKDAKK